MLGIPDAEHTYFDTETWYIDDAVSVAFVTLHGVGKHVRNLRSMITYEVIGGAGLFSLDGDSSWILMGPGSVISIDPGQGYQNQGHLTMLATSTPAFNLAYVEILENTIQ